MDLQTGAVLARPADGKGPFAPVFPIVFYTWFDDYLAQDLTIPAQLKAQGYVVISLIYLFPSFMKHVPNFIQVHGGKAKFVEMYC